MTKRQTKRQKQVDKQKQTVTKTVDTQKKAFDSMLSTMKDANVDSTARIADNKEAHETKLLETKQAQETRNKHAYKTKHSFKVSSIATMSRRSAVIALLHEAKYTKLDINSILLKTHDIADKSNNMKAISGTMYDLSQNSTCNFKTDSDSDIISCITSNCKYKK